MINRVLKYVNEHHMMDEGDCIVAGVSGGADSVCLFLMLLEIRKVIPIKIRVVHVNHRIRPDAAEDAAYVEGICRENGIPFTLVEKDVEALAKERRISTEEAGRDVRYEAFFRELGTERGRVAVAHNKNDCCETFLFNLFRGTSLKGLTGIKPVRGRIIRPLLCLERMQIEAFLHEKGMPYRIDSTNLEDNYSRNIIRRHILDTAINSISPAAVKNIGNACERVGEAYSLIEDITAEGYRACTGISEDDDGIKYVINKEKFVRLHPAVQGYVIMKVLGEAAGSGRDLESVHVRQVRELMDRTCGKMVKLPYRLYARRDYTGVCIYRGTDGAPGEVQFCEIVMSAGQKEALMSGRTVEIVTGSRGKISAALVKKSDFYVNLENIPQKKYTKWLDYDKIENGIVIRTRRQGDYLTINEKNQRKSLKSYFIDSKIPRIEREKTLLVADGSHVAWVIGGRLSSYYKVSRDTESILRITFEES